MNIVCPQCGAGVAYGLSSLANQTVVVCSTCQNGLRVTIEAFAVPVSAPEPVAAPAPTDARQRAVVAVQGEATRELIRDVLSERGFDVVEADSGSDAIAKVSAGYTRLLLVDVGLPDMPGFQVSETVRGNAATTGVGIILVAAIHNKDRYRRPPTNLYGADDYIERHQIEGELADKVTQLCSAPRPLGQASGDVAQEPTPVRREETTGPAPTPPKVAAPAAASAASPKAAMAPTPQPAPKPVQEATPKPPVEPPAPVPSGVAGGPPPAAQANAPQPTAPGPAAVATPQPSNPAQEAALRLARIIISDIALYNAKKVDEGVMNGTFFDLLRAEIEEGRKLYEERKGPGLATAGDLFQQTLDQFVATRRELLKRNRPAA